MIAHLPGDSGEEIGTKGCLKMKEGEPLEWDKTIKQYVIQSSKLLGSPSYVSYFFVAL